jgi:hypothetical protein
VHKLLNSIRYVALVAVVCSMLGAVLMFGIGAGKSYEAFLYALTDASPPPGSSRLRGPAWQSSAWCSPWTRS